MAESFDIVGIGCVAVDDLLFIDVFPEPDHKNRVSRSERQCGGLTGTALVAAAKLGGRCAFAGVLGEDELSQYVEANFTAHGVDVSAVHHRPDSRPIHAVIVVAERGQTRNIFFDPNAPIGAPDGGLNDKLLKSTRVLFLDHYGMEGAIRSAKAARAAKIPVVADFEQSDHPRFAELSALVDHLVLSQAFACQITGAKSGREAVRALHTPNRTVVVTCGHDGAWFAGPQDAEPNHCPAFRVNVVDTTGCGDVFHGAYALALARGQDLKDRIRYASAAAALKARKPGGQAGAPTDDEVRAFLKERAKP